MRIPGSFAIVVAISTASVSSCVSLRPTPLSDQATVSTFFSKVPDRPYREVAYVEYTGSIFDSRTRLLHRLQEQQFKAQGDALVMVRYDFVLWYPHASAVVIRYQ